MYLKPPSGAREELVTNLRRSSRSDGPSSDTTCMRWLTSASTENVHQCSHVSVHARHEDFLKK